MPAALILFVAVGVLSGNAMHIDNEPKPPRFVDLPELSRRLCLQRSAIFSLFANGELTRIKLSPKKTVVLEADLDSFIQRKVAEARQAG